MILPRKWSARDDLSWRDCSSWRYSPRSHRYLSRREISYNSCPVRISYSPASGQLLSLPENKIRRMWKALCSSVWWSQKDRNALPQTGFRQVWTRDFREHSDLWDSHPPQSILKDFLRSIRIRWDCHRNQTRRTPLRYRPHNLNDALRETPQASVCHGKNQGIIHEYWVLSYKSTSKWDKQQWCRNGTMNIV